jgi:uncharacterized protein (TIGR03067 family)
MRICTLLVLLASVAAAATPLDDAAKKELGQFQGSWKAVSIQQADGRQAPLDEVQNTRLVVEGNKFTLTGKNSTIAGTFTVNPTKTPRTIDVLLTSKDGRETRLLGIYQIQGDTRKTYFAMPGIGRPTSFSSENGHIGFEWRRN